MINGMKIKTARLVLRPFEMCDLDTTYEYANDHTITEYMLYLPSGSKEGTKRFLQKAINEWSKSDPLLYEFAVIFDGKHIGAASVALDESRQNGEIGWIIHKDYQGRGFATEAAKAVMDFAFDKLKVSKVIAHCDYRNKPSVRIMEKIGLSLEGDKGTRQNKGSGKETQELMYSAYRD